CGRRVAVVCDRYVDLVGSRPAVGVAAPDTEGDAVAARDDGDGRTAAVVAPVNAGRVVRQALSSAGIRERRHFDRHRGGAGDAADVRSLLLSAASATCALLLKTTGSVLLCRSVTVIDGWPSSA